MTKPTLQQVFGASATQTATTITITKADLVSTGLLASAGNTGESLLVALLLYAANTLNETNQTTNPETQITIAQSFDSLVTRNSATYRQRTYSVNLQKVDTSATIDPDDY
ncbi:MAG: hypothetical protein KME46_32345 [Brasilonema angustatum HA4187-MV1]|jgi:hypothetical protein|nr:hypothetical protein [Brasilonema angustatum HA4187-MV1]